MLSFPFNMILITRPSGTCMTCTCSRLDSPTSTRGCTPTSTTLCSGSLSIMIRSLPASYTVSKIKVTDRNNRVFQRFAKYTCSMTGMKMMHSSKLLTCSSKTHLMSQHHLKIRRAQTYLLKRVRATMSSIQFLSWVNSKLCARRRTPYGDSHIIWIITNTFSEEI